MGLVAPRHVGSSQTRARIHVPCIGRQILNHCATREAPLFTFFAQLNIPKLFIWRAIFLFVFWKQDWPGKIRFLNDLWGSSPRRYLWMPVPASKRLLDVDCVTEWADLWHLQIHDMKGWVTTGFRSTYALGTFTNTYTCFHLVFTLFQAE